MKNDEVPVSLELKEMGVIDASKAYRFLKKTLEEKIKADTRWNALKQKAIDYRFSKNGSHEDGRYCVAISVTDLLKWMEELEDNSE